MQKILISIFIMFSINVFAEWGPYHVLTVKDKKGKLTTHTYSYNTRIGQIGKLAYVWHRQDGSGSSTFSVINCGKFSIKHLYSEEENPRGIDEATSSLLDEYENRKAKEFYIRPDLGRYDILARTACTE